MVNGQEDRHLDEETLTELADMWAKGFLHDGVDGFGEDGKLGRDNGWFFFFAGKNDAPAEGRAADYTPFWSRGRARKKKSETWFRVCTRANIPLIFENDSPFGSVAATIMEEASEKNITKLGGLGNLSGMGTVDLSEKLQVAFSTHLLPPQLQEKTLRGKTWDLGNSEVGGCLFAKGSCAKKQNQLRRSSKQKRNVPC